MQLSYGDMQLSYGDMQLSYSEVAFCGARTHTRSTAPRQSLSSGPMSQHGSSAIWGRPLWSFNASATPMPQTYGLRRYCLRFGAGKLQQGRGLCCMCIPH